MLPGLVMNIISFLKNHIVFMISKKGNGPIEDYVLQTLGIGKGEELFDSILPER